MSRKYRKEREMKTTNRETHPPEILRYLDRLSSRVVRRCKPLPTFLEGLSEEERRIRIQDSRIVVFELLARRTGGLRLELDGDTLHPLGLRMDY